MNSLIVRKSYMSQLDKLKDKPVIKAVQQLCTFRRDAVFVA